MAKRLGLTIESEIDEFSEIMSQRKTTSEAMRLIVNYRQHKAWRLAYNF